MSASVASIFAFRPKLIDALKNYSAVQLRRDLFAGMNVMVLAFPLSIAFAIASRVKPEQGLFTAIIGGGIIAALSGSRVQIGGPTDPKKIRRSARHRTVPLHRGESGRVASIQRGTLVHFHRLRFF